MKGKGDSANEYVRTEFLRRIAHEVRSPLNVVVGALSEVASAELAPEHQHMMRLARRQVDRLVRLADKLSLTARAESGSLEMESQPVELRTTVAAAVKRATSLEPRREVNVSAGPEGEDAVRVMGDAQRLEQVLVELVINAVRNARGQVVVSVDTGADAATGEAWVRVEDDGDGFGDVAAAVQRFVPGRKIAGLGVGLSLARDVVSGHAGRLEVLASRLPPGRPGASPGAQVVLVLPRLNGKQIS